ncbi:hypothetical protein EMIHUDRAFT_454151 [Emiliania huxleyi CCMP1516]|uniref:Uncharacterized protein n=2 Tax=Emiliania huxleyi TaxID=2903 RepID=A0A0D3KY41_EMIH1|nr:hypothetical protein EMIHUDRAFT_454151 [Emiliania huxleyi CCMP1516]EOD40676.1 hypothetical protein EMIHUDRAFT_454151 [Emiliania huxleyi CCMP1516]|eukprot:XP_005793105.1 hypothetical protein EMIHUDRAFT_454151 [Emiliania huxleyi CCMP1516]
MTSLSSSGIADIASDLVASVDGSHGLAGSTAALAEAEVAGVGVSCRHATLEARLQSRAAGGPAAGEAGGSEAGEALTRPEAKSFKELGLSLPLLKAVQELGFEAPTPIQAAVVPAALRGLDICGSAAMGRKLGAHCDARFALVVGGLSSSLQEAELRTHPEVVVATPGRMLDLLRNSPAVGLEALEILVLDEADRLLDLGFRAEVEEVVRMCPPERQTLLFSATISAEVAELANASLREPLQVKVDALYGVAERLAQEFVRIKPGKEHEREAPLPSLALLLSLASRTFTSRAIVFVSSKAKAHRLRLLFGLSQLRAAELHGNLTQLQRLQALETFRLGEADFLIATDLAGRGLDIRGVETVINYELPAEMATYVLRHARGAVKSRVVPPVAVAHWAARIGAMEPQVREVLAEEAEDRALRVAEMEANKASNLLDHRAEILARPAKTWRAKAVEKKAGPALGKRAPPGGLDDEGPKKKKKAPKKEPSAEAAAAQVAAAARAKAKEMRALPARKVRSGSKSKFSKPRKR